MSLMNFTSIDFETANKNRDSACSVAVVVIENGRMVDVAVLVLGETESFTVNSEVVVAETVIVGEVPTTFLQTGGNYGS